MNPAPPPADATHPQTAPEVAAELVQVRAELAQLRAEFQDFVYTVSHDLRAPLRHIFAYAQVIEQDWPNAPPDMRGHLATIRGSAQLLTQQLEGLTQLSRIANQAVHLQALDPRPVLQSALHALMQRTPKRPVQWQLASDVPAVWADAEGLRQVLLQVLDNALKFSRDPDPAVIDVTWRRVPASAVNPSECIEICLQDRGVGFAPEQADKLFKVFGKLHPAREFEGLGLGLVLARKWLARMAGTIRVDGAVDGGCCVTITLPVSYKEF